MTKIHTLFIFQIYFYSDMLFTVLKLSTTNATWQALYEEIVYIHYHFLILTSKSLGAIKSHIIY